MTQVFYEKIKVFSKENEIAVSQIYPFLLEHWPAKIDASRRLESQYFGSTQCIFKTIWYQQGDRDRPIQTNRAS